MKRFAVLGIAAALAALLAVPGYAAVITQGESSTSGQQDAGQIYLYGERHGNENILNKELELWQDYYQNKGMRHLFVELPYYSAEYLNLWMQADDDAILEELYNDWEGTAVHIPALKDYYREIKRECPETVFHGTDVGHQYNTTGVRFLAYLEQNGLVDSEQYRLTQEAVQQGKTYQESPNDIVFRETKMVENFIREYDKLDGADIMGIYGAVHTVLDGVISAEETIPCMANQLQKRYGNAVHTENLTWAAKAIAPIRMDTITLGGKQYRASYFGKENLRGLIEGYQGREFWRLEDAYEDCKNLPPSGDVLPYGRYPMLIENGQVFVIDYTMTDGSVNRLYYRSDGVTWNGELATVGMIVE